MNEESWPGGPPADAGSTDRLDEYASGVERHSAGPGGHRVHGAVAFFGWRRCWRGKGAGPWAYAPSSQSTSAVERIRHAPLIWFPGNRPSAMADTMSASVLVEGPLPRPRSRPRPIPPGRVGRRGGEPRPKVPPPKMPPPKAPPPKWCRTKMPPPKWCRTKAPPTTRRPIVWSLRALWMAEMIVVPAARRLRAGAGRRRGTPTRHWPPTAAASI